MAGHPLLDAVASGFFSTLSTHSFEISKTKMITGNNVDVEQLFVSAQELANELEMLVTIVHKNGEASSTVPC